MKLKHQIIWSEDAGNELIEIISYIKNNTGKITVGKIYKKILTEIEKASKNASGRRISPLLKSFGINNIHQVAEPLYTIEPASPAERKKFDKRIKEYEKAPSCFVPYKKRVKYKPQ